MGLLSCPASFQRLMEGVLRDIQNVLVYMDDLLVHTDICEKHLIVLDKVLTWLDKNHLKINLEICIYGNKEVSYLGFTLIPEGIKPWKNKLKAITDAKPPTDIKMIRSFISLCNFFRTRIKDFALIVTPLFKLTRNDSGYKGGLLSEDANQGFLTLQKQLTSEPVMSIQKSDWHYACITDAATGAEETPGGLGAILRQVNKDGMRHFICIRQIKYHETITHLSFWKLLLQCREWTFLTNTLDAYISFSTQFTSLWKSWVICTTRHWTDYSWPF